MPEKKDNGILEIYKNEANKSLKIIKFSLENLKKDLNNQKEIFKLYRGAHTLKSSSFQMGFYSVGYLAHLMSDMLKEIKIREIKLTKKKLAFLHDFAGTLEKAVNNVLKNKEIKINLRTFKKIDKLLEKSEKERLRNLELEIYKKIKPKTTEQELNKMFLKTSEKLVNNINICLKNLKKDFENNTLCIVRDTHTLEGNALQAKKYILAYFSSKINSYVKKIMVSGKIKTSELAQLHDLINTLKTYFISIRKQKNIFTKKFTNRLNSLVKKDYLEIEKNIKW